ARRRARGRRGEGDGGHLVARRHLDPTVAVAERHVDALLEAERLDVELDRTVLIGHRDNDRADLVDASLGVGHDILLGLGLHRLRPLSPPKLIAVGPGGGTVSTWRDRHWR